MDLLLVIVGESLEFHHRIFMMEAVGWWDAGGDDNKNKKNKKNKNKNDNADQKQNQNLCIASFRQTKTLYIFEAKHKKWQSKQRLQDIESGFMHLYFHLLDFWTLLGWTTAFLRVPLERNL